MLRPILFACLAAGALLAADSDFDQSVKPVLSSTCTACHNDQLASGGLNIDAFLDPKSLTDGRDKWEKIIRKLRNGEMPPKGIPGRHSSRPTRSSIT